MKNTLVLLLLFIATAAFAQFENPFTGIRHSARDNDGNLHLRWDDFSLGQGTLECYYSAGTDSWSSAAVNSLPSLEMEALAPYTYGQKLRYRLRYGMDYMNEQVIAMHAAFWDADTFPPNVNRMAYIGTDPTGDSLMVYNPNLDLEESYMAKGPDKLYFSMKNQSGIFPTINGVTGFNIYLATIINPETVVDTLAYAMVYSVNSPGVLSSGLYKIRYDSATGMPSFTRLGNIQAQVSSGALHMACTMTDLTNDADFGAWPNFSNSLAMAGLTMSITIVEMQLSFNIGDYGTPALIVMEDSFYQQTANILPTVEFVSYNPDTHTFMLSYTDVQDDFPLTAEVISPSGNTYTAIPLGSDFAASVNYFVTAADLSWGEYVWNFSDNNIDTVSGVQNVVANDDPLQVPAAISCIMPNPVRELPLQLKLEGLGKEHLTVDIYNIKGQKVARLFDSRPSDKSLELSWNGLINNHKLPAGIYFIASRQNGRQTVQKFLAIP